MATQRPVAACERQELLGHDALEGHGELHAHLLLLSRREHVHDAVHGLSRVLGVERGEHEVAGLRGGERRGDGLEVSHLADEDHVGVLAKAGLERGREALRVGPQLTLVDDAPLVHVQELDRVLDGEDVLGARLVDQVDHRGERRGLARAGGARDEHEAARLLGQLLELSGQPEIAQRRHLLRDEPERGAERGALEVGVHPEAGAPGIE